MMEFLQTLEWPGAFAVVRSIGTIIFGIFGYLFSVRNKSPVQSKILTTTEYEKLHTRISDAVERVAVAEGDLKEVRASIRGQNKQIADHEQRDIQDFKLIDSKIDRLMDIVVRILQDEKL